MIQIDKCFSDGLKPPTSFCGFHVGKSTKMPWDPMGLSLLDDDLLRSVAP